MNGPIDFDLSWVDPAERFEFWHDVVSMAYKPIPLDPRQMGNLMVKARIVPTGEAVLGRLEASPQRQERTERMIKRDHLDGYLLTLIQQGDFQINSRHCNRHIKTGDIILLDLREACHMDWSAHTQIYAALPREFLASSTHQDLTTSVLASENPCAKILNQYMKEIWNVQHAGDTSFGAKLSQGLASLTRIYFSDQPLIVESELEASQDTLIHPITNWIDSQLHRSSLNAAAIAAEFHISRSTLYELFRPWGGVMTYIQTRRLVQARHILECSGPQISIGLLAMKLGFRSLSSFSRSFRDHWGITPKEARQHYIERISENSENQLRQSSDGSVAGRLALQEEANRYYSAVRTTMLGTAHALDP
jgi:AraC-like DNA-binding protein